MDEPTRLTPPTVVDVHFVLLDDSLILDWAGPAEALRMANQSLLAKGRPAAFALHFTGPRAETVSSVGARVSHLAPLPDLSQPSARSGWCWWASRATGWSWTALRRASCCTGCAACA